MLLTYSIPLGRNLGSVVGSSSSRHGITYSRCQGYRESHATDRLGYTRCLSYICARASHRFEGYVAIPYIPLQITNVFAE